VSKKPVAKELVKLKKPTKKELADLWCKVDSEGFGYYMLQYGPDWKLIERMGFDVDKLKAACDELRKLDNAISDLEELVGEDD
jgi:hypothetical protein